MSVLASSFSFVSSSPLILVSAYAQAPRQRSCREFLAVWACCYSRDQILIRQPPPGCAFYEAFQPQQGMPRHITFVEAESELIDVATEMLVADVMEGAIDTALEYGEDALYSVRCHVITDELGRAMVDRLVGEPRETPISRELIRMNSRTGLNVLADFVVDHAPVSRLDGQCNRAPAALSHPENSSLADCSAPSMELLVFVLITLLAADVGLINFHDPSQLLEFRAARLPKSTKDEPSGLLRNAYLFGELHRRDALTRGHNEVHRIDPLMQRNVRALEDRAGANGEILLALVAAVIAALAGRDPIAETAVRAANAIRPEPSFEVDPRSFLIGKHLEKLEGRNGAAGHRKPLSTST